MGQSQYRRGYRRNAPLRGQGSQFQCNSYSPVTRARSALFSRAPFTVTVMTHPAHCSPLTIRGDPIARTPALI